MDFSISHFDNAVAVQQGLERLRTLMTYACLDPDGEVPKEPVLKVLREYCDGAKTAMNEELRRKSSI